jgi:hypothetical protein
LQLSLLSGALLGLLLKLLLSALLHTLLGLLLQLLLSALLHILLLGLLLATLLSILLGLLLRLLLATLLGILLSLLLGTLLGFQRQALSLHRRVGVLAHGERYRGDKKHSDRRPTSYFVFHDVPHATDAKAAEPGRPHHWMGGRISPMLQVRKYSPPRVFLFRAG